MDVVTIGDFLGLPSYLVGSEGRTISEVREEGEGSSLNGSSVDGSLQSEIVSHL